MLSLSPLLALTLLASACAATEPAGPDDEGGADDSSDQGASGAKLDDAAITSQLAAAVKAAGDGEVILNPGTQRGLRKLDWLVTEAVAWPPLLPVSKSEKQCNFGGPSDHVVALQPTRDGRWASADLPTLTKYDTVQVTTQVAPLGQSSFVPVICLVGGPETGHMGACVKGYLMASEKNGTTTQWGYNGFIAHTRSHPALWPLLDRIVVTSLDNFEAASTGLPAHDETKEIGIYGNYYLKNAADSCAP